MSYRLPLLCAVSALSLVASVAHAQTAQDGTPPVAAAAPGDSAEVEEVVVTGTRVAGRTRLDTVSPVDVLPAETLARQGNGTELAQALANTTPAISFPRPAITDGSDHVRAATLRGLAPDQTLVLVNGVRGHVGALVALNGSIGRGSTQFDLNTIPAISLATVEILRDGASAQYGADAIAGVINLRLREAREGGSATFNYGVHDTEFTTSRGQREADDGVTTSVAAWQGLPLGEEGFLTISGEYAKRGATNRSDYANPTALPEYGRPIVLGRFGDPEVESYTVYANAALPLNESFEVYGTAGYQDRTSDAAATARAYNNAGNLGENGVRIYPGGFLPFIGTGIIDYNLIGGVRGDAGGFDLDFSVGYGKNELDYTVFNSVNASFGTASPRTFDAGGISFDQLTVGLDASRGYEVGFAGPLNVAFGAEYRREGFEVFAGEPASYTVGPVPGRAGVSQGFPGLRPSNAEDIERDSVGVYVDLEGEVVDNLTVGLAARYEEYSDFGDTLTGKISARYDFTDDLALRGSVSSGFKAPALQQQFFSYTSTNAVSQVVNGQTVTSLIEAGTFRVTDAPAVALGAQPLDAETSTNYSLGTVFSRGAFELTVDAYRIEIEDRIVLTENLGVGTISTTPAQLATIAAILQPFGVSAARFFVNGVETTTQGLDIVSRYRFVDETLGRFDLLAAANFNDTEVDRVPPQTAAIPQRLVDRNTILTFEEGTPERKLIGSVDWTLDRYGATFKATNYESVLVPNNSSATLDYSTGDATLIDLEGRVELPYGVRLAVGVNNVTDEYPNFTPGGLNSPTGSVGFPSYSPFGFNGRFLYARVGVDW